MKAYAARSGCGGTAGQQLESFRLAPWASRRRRDLLELMDRLNPTITELTQAIEQEVEKCPPINQCVSPGSTSLSAHSMRLTAS
jgi:hypothetical protein